MVFLGGLEVRVGLVWFCQWSGGKANGPLVIKCCFGGNKIKGLELLSLETLVV